MSFSGKLLEGGFSKLTLVAGGVKEDVLYLGVEQVDRAHVPYDILYLECM
jgi:hypothetical protein